MPSVFVFYFSLSYISSSIIVVLKSICYK